MTQRDDGWDVVRARHPRTGDHYTTTRQRAHRLGATVLDDHPAVDQWGRWLPTKPNTTLPVRDQSGRFTTTPDAGTELADTEETP